jgi:hypothetical protein
MDYISRIMAGARIRLTGAVDDAIKLALFETVDEFLRETNVWKEAIPFITVAHAPDLVYDLVPTKGTILRLVGLNVTGQVRQISGVMQVPGELFLVTPFDSGVDITATVSLAPLDPVAVGSEWPDIDPWIYQRYYTALIDGLIMKMASQPDKPYTSDNLVVYHGKRFRNAIGVTRADIEKGNVGDGQAWRFPSFAVQRNSSSQVN